MPTCVVTILGPWYPSYPILGFGSGETPQIHLQCSIDHFGLAIRLREICRRKIEAGALKTEQLCPKSTSESRIPITHIEAYHANGISVRRIIALQFQPSKDGIMARSGCIWSSYLPQLTQQISLWTEAAPQ